jgi:hypothetical protein
MRKKKTVAAKHCREGRIPYLPQSFSLKTCATALERYTDLRQLAGTRLLLDALCKQMTFEEAHTAVTEFDIRNSTDTPETSGHDFLYWSISRSLAVAGRFSVVERITPVWSVKKVRTPACHLTGLALTA